MKKFTLIMVLFVVWSRSMEFGAETGPQGSDAGKSLTAASKSPEEQKKTGKDAAVQPQVKKKKSAKKDEDCGCETTLFGEPVPPLVQKPAQGKASRAEGKQTTKSKVKNMDQRNTATKSELKEGALENTEKQPESSGNAVQSKNPAAQPADK